MFLLASSSEVHFVLKCEEQWRVAKAFGHLAKGAWLAACLVDKTLPRCSLEALKGEGGNINKYLNNIFNIDQNNSFNNIVTIFDIFD